MQQDLAEAGVILFGPQTEMHHPLSSFSGSMLPEGEEGEEAVTRHFSADKLEQHDVSLRSASNS